MYNSRWDYIVSGVSAGSDFSANTVVLHHGKYSVQVVWSGIDTNTGSLKIGSSNDYNNYSDLCAPQTMACGSTSIIFREQECNYASVNVVYDANSNTTGTLDVWVVRKQ